MNIRKPEMFKLAEKGGERKIGKQIFTFFVIFLLINIAITIIATVFIIGELVKEITNLGLTSDNIEAINTTIDNFINEFENSHLFMYLNLFGTIIGTIIVLLWARFNEKRSFRSLGFQRENAFRDYLIGAVIGLVMFSLVVGINILTGSMSIKLAIQNLNSAGLGVILIFFVGFLFQGAYEEILVRGYLMVNIGAKYKTLIALIVSSIIFAVLHALNPGITILSVINLVLVAIFFGLYIICFDNIWGACAMHSIWNFAQGNFYGIKVSGLNTFESIFVSTSIPGKEFINGGSFGAEGGIATTIVITLSIVLLLLYMKKKGILEENFTKNSMNAET